jgi:cyclophilin family peptidyl-prolyl cis-trans isomerase
MKRWFLRWLGVLLTISGSSVGAGVLVQFHTPAGVIAVELFDQDKPFTVQNFLRYAREGVYTNMFLHYCQPATVLQGGGYRTGDRTIYQPAKFFFTVPTFAPIRNEFSAGRRFSNTNGTLAMATVPGHPDSATSQWFFNLTNNSAKDTQNGGTTVFGRVVGGTNALFWFATLQPGGGGVNPYGGIVNLTTWYGQNAAVFSALPVLYSGFTPPLYTDLAYVDITVLATHIQRTTNGVTLSWNSVPNRTNRLQFSDQVPPLWRDLMIATGTGEIMTTTDLVALGTRRLYRVSVDY